MTRALVTQLVEALEKLSDTEQTYAALDKADAVITAAREYLATEPKPTLTETLAQQGIKLRTEFEPKQRNVELATEPSGERAALVEKLRRIAAEGMADYASTGYLNSNAIRKAADMLEADASLRTQLARRTVERDMAISMLSDTLEADAQPATPDIKDLQAKGKGPAPCAKFCEANSFQIEIRRLTAELNAQQAKRVPMSGEEIDAIMQPLTQNTAYSWRAFARAIEAHHGITPADKGTHILRTPTDWSAA